jgi:hypothetical protein
VGQVVVLSSERLTIIPITLKAAKRFVAEHHRHNKPPVGHKFSIGVIDEAGHLVGVATVGRPVAGPLDDGLTAEVARTCTAGYPNANSALYGAAWRICRAMGYRRLTTYTQADESGSSLVAAGFTKVADLPPRKNWARSSVALRGIRDAEEPSGVARARWERSA